MVVTRFTIFETRGGAVVDEVEPSSWDWQEQSNTAETINLTFVDGVAGWRNRFTPYKHSLAVEVGGAGGRVLGGPILPSALDRDKRELTVVARGFRYLLDRAFILPATALSAPDALAPDGVPDVAFDTAISGVDRGTIGKRVIQQLLTWPGWDDIPVVFPPDRAGSNSQTYPAADLKTVESALSDLSAQLNGPDIRLRLTRTSSDSFGWVYEAGTDAQPRLQGDTPLMWEPNDLTGFGVRLDPSRMGSMVWTNAGRSSDKTLIRSAYDPYLVDRGFPLLHLESGGSSTISDPATADSWNAESLRTARSPWDFWSFEVPANQSPFPQEYGCGDLAEITLSPLLQWRAGLLSGLSTLSGPWVLSGPFKETNLADYLESRTYTRRIVGIAGGADSDMIKITCAETYDA